MPNFSTLSRRQNAPKVNIPYRGSQGSLHLLADSTGIKGEGEGEWNARKHGGAKLRVWHKIHKGTDEQTLEIRPAEFTTSDASDAPMLPELLVWTPPKQEIASIAADGAFDTRKCRDPTAPQECPALGARHPGRTRPQRSPARIKTLRPHDLAKMERLSSPEPR